MTIPEITKLLEAEKFGEAETALYELLKADRQNTSVACLLGSLYEHYSNPARSRENAKKYFSSAATGIPPVEEAFVGLARLEGHSNHAIRIIEKGLSVFPKSQPLLLQLFRHNALENREAVFLQAESQGVASDDMRAEMVSGFVALRQFEKALKLLDTIKKQSLLETRDLMTAVCLLELKQIEKAKEIFRRIVADDIDHKFIYVPNFGLIASFVELQSRSAFELLSEIPIEVAWSSTEFAY
jgi:tetratricopeptide (TPR) repeat protein